jgi:hypothetical protein
MGTEGVGSNRVSPTFGYDTEIDGDTVVLVQIGENEIKHVAKRLNVDPGALLMANPQINNPSSLSVGQEVRVPERRLPAADQQTESGAPQSLLSPAPMGDPLAKSAVQANLQSKIDDENMPLDQLRRK